MWWRWSTCTWLPNPRYNRLTLFSSKIYAVGPRSLCFLHAVSGTIMLTNCRFTFNFTKFEWLSFATPSPALITALLYHSASLALFCWMSDWWSGSASWLLEIMGRVGLSTSGPVGVTIWGCLIILATFWVCGSIWLGSPGQGYSSSFFGKWDNVSLIWLLLFVLFFKLFLKVWILFSLLICSQFLIWDEFMKWLYNIIRILLHLIISTLQCNRNSTHPNKTSSPTNRLNSFTHKQSVPLHKSSSRSLTLTHGPIKTFWNPKYSSVPVKSSTIFFTLLRYIIGWGKWIRIFWRIIWCWVKREGIQWRLISPLLGFEKELSIRNLNKRLFSHK